jgi:hypothetical protein
MDGREYRAHAVVVDTQLCPIIRSSGYIDLASSLFRHLFYPTSCELVICVISIDQINQNAPEPVIPVIKIG